MSILRPLLAGRRIFHIFTDLGRLEGVWGHVEPRGIVFSLLEGEDRRLERQGDPEIP